jgi:arylsulfatase A-like enzyme
MGALLTNTKRSIALAMLFMVIRLVSGDAQSPGESPRLAVLIVVDQMRADYVDRFGDDWTAGLRRLLHDGARFSNAAFPYLNTFTCTGHATVSTGTLPLTHGVVGNSWYDRSLRRVVTCTEQPDVDALGYGVATGAGNGPFRLQVPTFSDEMKRQRGARVVSLSLKARSAIMLAGRSGDTVTWLAPTLDGFETSTAYTQTPVAEVDAFLRANPIAADFGKTWSRLLPESRYPEPDDAIGEAPPPGWSSSFPHVIGGGEGRVAPDYYQQWQSSPLADAYLGRFAAYLVDTMRLGRDDHTDVLAIAFSTPDYVGHSFGPSSQEVRDTYARLDVTLGALFDRLDTLVGRDQYIVALSADHGVAQIPEQALEEGRDGGRISVASLSALIEETAVAAAGVRGYLASVACCGAHTGNDIYLLPGAYDRLQGLPGALEAIVQALQKQSGIARVFRREELIDPAGETDRLLLAAAASYRPELSGDLVLALEPGWMFVAKGTTHGTASALDQRVPLLLMGPGVTAGTYNEPATPADLAPTLAAIFGIDMPHVDGRVLRTAVK